VNTTIDEATIDEIVQRVLETGGLSKGQILATWGVTEHDYKDLQKLVLNKNRSIVKGPPKVGGFIIAKRKGKFPDEGAGDEFLLNAEWERGTVERLASLLEHSHLEALLGSLLTMVRQVRKQQTGVDRRGTKPELATALVLQHGIDLFCNLEIRRRVAKACGTEHPGAWHPGKPAAHEFVKSTGFPRELAGIPTQDVLPDYEFLVGRFKLKELQPFQLEVKKALLDTLQEPGRRAIVTLPTGAGKTRVAVESIREWMGSRYDVVAKAADGATVLWLAHTEELCEQAYACFKQVWEDSENVCPLLLVRFWGNFCKDLAKHRTTLQQVLSRPSVLISTPQRMVNILDGHVQGGEAVIEDLNRALGLLLIDEAHRAAAPSYDRILHGLKTRDRHVSVAGLTATPYRSEYLDNPEEGTRRLKGIFDNLIEPTTLGDRPRERLERLQNMRILARPIFDTIKTPKNINLKDVLEKHEEPTEEEAEGIDQALAVRADNNPRRLAILERVLPFAKDPENSILYFGPNVRDAECMAYLLRREGISAGVVSGTTRDATRRQVVTDFKKQTIRVLCNCQVLTTGFDAPKVTHLVIARPTVSGVLYEQILGRGLRGPAFGGTETCTVLECEDNPYREGRSPDWKTFYEGSRSTDKQPEDREDKDAAKSRFEKKFGWGPGDVDVVFPMLKNETDGEKEQ
jgi:DNA repair protein RadD